MASRYGVSPRGLRGKTDLIDHIAVLNERMYKEEVATQAGFTAIEEGNFTVRGGDIIVSETDDTVVLRLLHGTVPAIEFYPLGENADHYSVIYGNDAFLDGQALTLGIFDTDDNNDGGLIVLRRTQLGLACTTNADVGQQVSIALNADETVGPELFGFTGRWANQWQFGTRAGLYVGSFVASSGFSTWTHSYFASFATSVIPVCTVLHAGSTIQWVLESFSTSAFTVRFSSTTNAKTINFWNFRI